MSQLSSQTPPNLSMIHGLATNATLGAISKIHYAKAAKYQSKSKTSRKRLNNKPEQFLIAESVKAYVPNAEKKIDAKHMTTARIVA